MVGEIPPAKFKAICIAKFCFLKFSGVEQKAANFIFYSG